MNLNLVVLSIPIFFFLIGIELLYDRIVQRRLYRLHDSLANISCGITEQISGVFAKVFTIAAYDVVYQNFRIMEIPNTWYWWILAFVGVDFFYYWAHRLSHEVNLFWAGHVVHHQSEEYNLSVALRQGAFQKLFTFYFYFPLAFVGFSTELFLSISAINLLYQFWIHTEAIDRMPVFEWVFNTPSHHRVHHGRDPKYIDKNHGGTFIIWDRIFGTFQDEDEKPTYGITKPLNTFNPLYAQVSHFFTLARDFKRMKGAGEIWSLLWNKPGWHPERLGGTRVVESIDHNVYEKYEVEISTRMNLYIFVQYVLSLGITAGFLFTQGQMDWTQKILFTIWIFLSVGALGLLSDGLRMGSRMEWLRSAFGLGIGIFFLLNPGIPIWITALIGLSLILFISWYPFIKKRVFVESDQHE